MLTVRHTQIRLGQRFTADQECSSGSSKRGNNKIMNWTRSETLALANQRCSVCRGIGMRDGRKEDKLPCKCVLRAIFRICFQRFVECVTVDSTISQVRIERRPGKAGHVTWGRKQEEYIADFMKLTERTLTPAQFRLFR